MADDLIAVEFDTKDVRDLLTKAPERFAASFTTAAWRSMNRYGGFHRVRGMRRQSISERVNIFATRGDSGLLNPKWVRVRRLGGRRLGDAGAEARVNNIIFKQLEAGVTVRPKKAKSLALPTTDARDRKGKTTARARRLFRDKRVRRMRTRNGTFLVHWPGYPRKGGKEGRRKRRASQRRPPQFLFVLKDSIRVPPRTRFREIFLTEYAPRVLEAIELEFARTVAALNNFRGAT